MIIVVVVRYRTELRRSGIANIIMPPVPGFVYRISIACHNHFIPPGFILDLPNTCGVVTNKEFNKRNQNHFSQSNSLVTTCPVRTHKRQVKISLNGMKTLF
jgi:hypothetical protein